MYLTASETRVIRLLLEGCSDHETATSVGLSIHTVRSHYYSAAKRVGARSRAHLAAIVIRRNLLGGLGLSDDHLVPAARTSQRRTDPLNGPPTGEPTAAAGKGNDAQEPD
ncbi:response regulator transcription factor [Jannaschia sp. R86511]|uniref:response regulator transcription factor n=1 Tax=Jannaschia sp. R86511 TaxID=3093853 RepID=UPI0036D22F8D